MSLLNPIVQTHLSEINQSINHGIFFFETNRDIPYTGYGRYLSE
ncbi:hypothetical protein LEP1GSC065_3166 [Leptospira kirschneri serovar Sokoine str. RM1]|nr:hypothetical protein LEP1GSC065_3166 [Leptospira kirschneri serovar Sokoine str. RM1]